MKRIITRMTDAIAETELDTSWMVIASLTIYKETIKKENNNN